MRWSCAIAVGSLVVVGACGAAPSAPTPVATLDTSVTTRDETVATPTSTPASTTTTVMMTSTTVANNVATTISLIEPLDAVSVSERLAQARVRWEESGIASYRLTVAENLNFWSAGCTWQTEISSGL